MTEMLATGAKFPDLTLKIPGGETINLPGGLKTPLNIVLFYRGHW